MRHYFYRLGATMQRQLIKHCSSCLSLCFVLLRAAGVTCRHLLSYRSGARRKWPLVLAAVVVMLLYLAFQLTPGYDIYLPPGVNLEEYEPFEPLVNEEFPQGETNDPKMPRIIHQTFQYTNIPPCFHDNIKSLVSNNPGWTYYMWTDETSRQFVMDTHPELLETFDGYHEGIRRADFIRYVILYEIGGMYADLDTMTYRSLDLAITKHGCIFPTEPFEHAALRAYSPYLINNAIMMCRPKHPFLKFMLDNLPRFLHMFKVLDATGPSFVTTMYMQYNNLTREPVSNSNRKLTAKDNAPYFYKGALPEDDPRTVYVPNSQYFCNTLDTSGVWWFYHVCQNFFNLNLLSQRACVNMKKRGMVRRPNKYAFIEHTFYRTYGWWHFYNYLDLYLYLFSKDIRKLVPHVTFYESKESTDKSSKH